MRLILNHITYNFSKYAHLKEIGKNALLKKKIKNVFSQQPVSTRVGKHHKNNLWIYAQL